MPNLKLGKYSVEVKTKRESPPMTESTTSGGTTPCRLTPPGTSKNQAPMLPWNEQSYEVTASNFSNSFSNPGITGLVNPFEPLNSLPSEPASSMNCIPLSEPAFEELERSINPSVGQLVCTEIENDNQSSTCASEKSLISARNKRKGMNSQTQAANNNVKNEALAGLQKSMKNVAHNLLSKLNDPGAEDRELLISNSKTKRSRRKKKQSSPVVTTDSSSFEGFVISDSASRGEQRKQNPATEMKKKLETNVQAAKKALIRPQTKGNDKSGAKTINVPEGVLVQIDEESPRSDGGSNIDSSVDDAETLAEKMANEEEEPIFSLATELKIVGAFFGAFAAMILALICGEWCVQCINANLSQPTLVGLLADNATHPSTKWIGKIPYYEMEVTKTETRAVYSALGNGGWDAHGTYNLLQSSYHQDKAIIVMTITYRYNCPHGYARDQRCLRTRDFVVALPRNFVDKVWEDGIMAPPRLFCMAYLSPEFCNEAACGN